MADLTGKKISNTYKDLLKIKTDSDNSGVDSTVRFIQDGEGNNTALKISNSEVATNGNVSVGGNLTISGTLGAGTFNHTNITASGRVEAVSVQASAIRADKVCATTLFGDGSNLTGIVVGGAASAGTSATLQTKINAVSAALQLQVNYVSAVVSNNTSVGTANAAAIVALSATLESRIAVVSSIIPRGLTSLTNNYWKTTTTTPTSSGGKPEGFVWYVIS
tara:strand:- start:116 stop:775 length:660 start_codon:yes stop_codon:yes gene_type:complete